MAQTRKTIFSLGGPTAIDDPRVAEAQRNRQLDLQQQAQQATFERAALEADAQQRRAAMDADASRYGADARAKAQLAEALIREAGWSEREDARGDRERELTEMREGGAWGRAFLGHDAKVGEAKARGESEAAKAKSQAEKDRMGWLLDSIKAGGGTDPRFTQAGLQREENIRARLAGLLTGSATDLQPQQYVDALSMESSDPEAYNRTLAQAARQIAEHQQRAGTEFPSWSRAAAEVPLDLLDLASEAGGTISPEGAVEGARGARQFLRGQVDSLLGAERPRKIDTGNLAAYLQAGAMDDPASANESKRAAAERLRAVLEQSVYGVDPKAAYAAVGDAARRYAEETALKARKQQERAGGTKEFDRGVGAWR